MDARSFLEQNWSLLESQNFDDLYKKAIDNAEEKTTDIPEITNLILQAGINPLDFMTYVPEFYALGLDIDNVEIGSKVKEIRVGSFMKCKTLKNVIIPERVTFIHDTAFIDCSSDLKVIAKSWYINDWCEKNNIKSDLNL